MNDKKFRLHYFLPLLFAVIVVKRSSAQELHNRNARMIMSGPVYLVVQDMNLVNNGTITAQEGNVLITGEQANTLAGNNPVTWNNVAINKAAGKTVELWQSMAVQGTLSMISGNVLLNNYQLDLGDTGNIAGEGSQSFITGTGGGAVLVTRKLATPPAAFNPGNIGVELTSDMPLGIVTIERKHVQELLPGYQKGIQRSFTIKSSNTRGFDATLRFYYLDEETGGADETSLVIWTDSDISNSWILAGKDGSDAVFNWVSKSGLDRWGRFTLAGSGGDKKIAGTVKKLLPVSPKTMKVQVYPNPANDECTAMIYCSEAKPMTFQLSDQGGHLLIQKNVSCIEGWNKITWDLRPYAGGVYYMTDNTGMIRKQIIKL